jgi:hypothetical protein
MAPGGPAAESRAPDLTVDGALRLIRTLARRLLGVHRIPTYFLPWITRPGLDCSLLLHNVESRLRAGAGSGPFVLTLHQYDARGRCVAERSVTLADPLDTVEVPLPREIQGHGFVTVDVDAIRSDLYVALATPESYTATHGRHEFVERYPARARGLLAALGSLLALAGRTVPAFARDQYVYAGADSRSHLLLLNLSNVTNRIRVSLESEAIRWRARIVRIRPMGAHLLALPAPEGHAGLRTGRLHAVGNAWFNLYVVGAGPRDLAGPLSLMHVK